MTIDDHVLEALHHNLNHYAETGLKDYAKMIEFDLKIIKQNYGQDVYNKLNHIYQGIREVFDGGS